MKDSLIIKEEVDQNLHNMDSGNETNLFNSSQEDVNKSHLNKYKVAISTSCDNTQPVILKESPYRFVVVIVYCCLSFANAFQWVTYSACSDKFRNAYGTSRFMTDMFSMIYMIAYPFACLPEAYIIDNVSPRLGLNISSVLTIAGACLKCLMDKGLFFAYLGQTLVALFQPAILNSPAKIASAWFKEGNRTLVTSICCISNTIGVVGGFIFHIFFISEDSTIEEFKDQFSLYLFWELGLIFCLCSPTLIFMSSKPDYPPRYSVSNTDISYLVGIANVIGIISAIIVSSMLDRYKKYKIFLLVLNIIALCADVALTVLMELFEKWSTIFVSILWTLVMAMVIPIYTCCMDYVCELTYPVGESISGGIIMTANQISGIILIIVCDCFLTYFPGLRYLTNVLSIGLFLISLCSIYLIDEKLLRHEKDNEPDQGDTLVRSDSK